MIALSRETSNISNAESSYEIRTRCHADCHADIKARPLPGPMMLHHPVMPRRHKPVIFVCGDSTAKNSGTGKNGSPVAGWGTPIAEFFDSNKAVVNNVGHAGRSSMTYYNGDWPNVLPKSAPAILFSSFSASTTAARPMESATMSVKGPAARCSTPMAGTCRKWPPMLRQKALT